MGKRVWAANDIVTGSYAKLKESSDCNIFDGRVVLDVYGRVVMLLFRGLVSFRIRVDHKVTFFTYVATFDFFILRAFFFLH